MVTHGDGGGLCSLYTFSIYAEYIFTETGVKFQYKFL